jgi:hypothetical protein
MVPVNAARCGAMAGFSHKDDSMTIELPSGDGTGAGQKKTRLSS